MPAADTTLTRNTESRDSLETEHPIDLERLQIELKTYGFVIIRGLISADEAELAAKRITEIMKTQPEADQRDQHLGDVLDQARPEDYPLFARLLAHPVCLKLAQHLLGEGFQLTEPGARWRKPGSAAGPIHITAPVDRLIRSGLASPNTCFDVPFSWNLNDLTADMGATYYLPFSHLAPGAPWPGMPHKYATPGEGPAGTLVIHHGGLWHGFGPNTTRDRYRVGLMAGYCAYWMDPVPAGYQLPKRSVRDRMPQAMRNLMTRVRED